MTSEVPRPASQPMKSRIGRFAPMTMWWISARHKVRSGRPRSGSDFRSSPRQPWLGEGSARLTTSGRIFLASEREFCAR